LLQIWLWMYYELILYLPTQGGLPMYVASRGLYNLPPPTVFVPPCIKDDVEKLLEIHRAMGQVELNLDLVALDVGMKQ
jgi:ribonuclease Z